MHLLPLLLACGGADDERTPDSGGDDSGTDSDSDSGGDTDTGPTPPWTADDEDAVRKQLKRDVRNCAGFASQIAVWYDGALVWNEATGTRTDGGDDPIDTDTLFQIGSDTKKITAIALLQQVAAGRLSLDDRVGDALGGLTLAASPDWAEGATLHDLISHQGGLYDYTPWDDAPDDAELHDRAWEEVAPHAWAMVPAGVTWNYANPNFSLAGLATEAADGRPWADLVEDDVFAPLGMTRTFARQSEVVADGNVGNSYGLYDWESDPYDVFAESSYSYGEATVDDLADNAFTRPAGLVWSTAADQARLLAFLLDGDPSVLADDLRARITTSQVPVYWNFPPQGYGYGLFVFEGFSMDGGWVPLTTWKHGGNTLSYTSTSLVYPEQRLVVSILVNAYAADLSATEAAVLEHFLDLPAVEAFPADPVDLAVETDHAALVGTYADVGFGRIEITDVDGTLHAAFPDMTDAGVDLDADLTFVWADEYVLTGGMLRTYDLHFVPDETGAYTWVRDRLFVGTRADAAAARRAHPVRRAIGAPVASPRPSVP